MFALEPTRDVLFLQPRKGVAQPIDEVVSKPRIGRVIPADISAPLNLIIEQSPRKKLIAVNDELAPSRLITVPFPDLVVQRFLPTVGAPQVIEELPPSRIIKVTPADNKFLYFGPMLKGAVQPIDERVRASKIVIVTPADILPPFLLLQQQYRPPNESAGFR